MLVPRMHLEMMLTHCVNLHYQRSVLGVFDLAVALATLENHQTMRKQFEAAQRVMYQLIHGSRDPYPEEGDLLRQSFNQADRHFAIQSRAMLVKAFDIVDQLLTRYQTIDLSKMISERS